MVRWRGTSSHPKCMTGSMTGSMNGPDDFRALLLKSAASELPLREETRASVSVMTWIGLKNGEFLIRRENEEWVLSKECISKVFERYAAPLERAGEFRAHLMDPEGAILAHMRFVPTFDVEPKDYLVLSVPGEVPLVELCAVLGPPLIHLAQTFSRR